MTTPPIVNISNAISTTRLRMQRIKVRHDVEKIWRRQPISHLKSAGKHTSSSHLTDERMLRRPTRTQGNPATLRAPQNGVKSLVLRGFCISSERVM